MVNLEGTEVLEGDTRTAADYTLSGLPLFRLQLGLALAVELLNMRSSRAYRHRTREGVLT